MKILTVLFAVVTLAGCAAAVPASESQTTPLISPNNTDACFVAQGCVSQGTRCQAQPGNVTCWILFNAAGHPQAFYVCPSSYNNQCGP